MRISFSWHLHTKYSIPPAILYNTIPLLNEDFLRFHLLELCNSLFGLSELLSLVGWNSEAVFRKLSGIKVLDRFLGLLGVGVKRAELFTFLVEWNVVEEALAAKSRHVISPQKAGGFLALLVYERLLDLLSSGEGNESCAWAHISVDLWN